MVDVFVIGGGPAGLAAAIAARKKGFSVVVADGACPSLDKPCGEGLLPGALAALDRLHVSIPPSAGFAFCGIRFIDGPHHIHASFPRCPGLGLRRTILHGLLAKCAKKNGIELLWGAPVRAIMPRTVAVGTEIVPARWIIGADGSGSLVRRWSGLEKITCYSRRFARCLHYAVKPWSRHMEIHWGADSQAYVTPVAAGETGVVLISHRKQILDDDTLRDFPELAARLVDAQMTTIARGAVTVAHSLQRVYRDNVALIGDASGGVDAITGEGLRLAFEQADALAGALEADDLRRYQQAHRQIMRRPVRMGNLMLLLGNHHVLRHRFMRKLASRPEILSRLLAIHLGETSVGHLAATAARLGFCLLAA